MVTKKIMQYMIISSALLGNTLAMEDAKELIIGSCPWDANVQGFSRLQTAHFVDFCNWMTPETLPANIFRHDLNDEGQHGAGKFSEFAVNNAGNYKSITIDWITEQHVRRESAWADFARLLRSDGFLIIPVIRLNPKTSGKTPSQVRAEELVSNNLTSLFREIKIINFDEIAQEDRCDYLLRPNFGQERLQMTKDMLPAIIIATK